MPTESPYPSAEPDSAGATLSLARAGDLPLSSDLEQIAALIPLEGARLLELGCGAAVTTRRLATTFPVGELIAMEVDRIQHQKNLEIRDLPAVRFVYGGAEAIDLPDASVDAVLMLKSLHHVPVEVMDRAFEEIARVLRPGGLAYLSEPVYAGAFNEIMRLFNDEQVVRQAAFDAIGRALDRGLLTLEREVHFLSRSEFDGFAEFERRILGATHSQYDIGPELHQRIRTAFMAHVGADGRAGFHNPMRVDLLRKAAA